MEALLSLDVSQKRIVELLKIGRARIVKVRRECRIWKKRGRPKTDIELRIRALREQGNSWQAITAALRCSRSTIAVALGWTRKQLAETYTPDLSDDSFDAMLELEDPSDWTRPLIASPTR